MARSYNADMKVAGIVYLQEITQTRITGTVRINLDMFEKLCDAEAASSIILATSKWSLVRREVGEKRESQLRDEHWKDMLMDGSKLRRFDGSQGSAMKIVNEILGRAPLDATHIQSELVKVDKLLAETDAGRTLRYTLKELLAQQKEAAVQLQQGGDDAQVVENDKKIRSLLRQVNDLKITLDRSILRIILLEDSPRIQTSQDRNSNTDDSDRVKSGGLAFFTGKGSYQAMSSYVVASIARKPPVPKESNSRVDTVNQLSNELTLAFQDVSKCKRLQSCVGSEAQNLLDTFQIILDTGTPDSNLRRNLIIAIRKLSSKTDLYPTPFYLKKLDHIDKNPRTDGHYGDIYRGRRKGRDICLKSIKVYRTSSAERIQRMITREAVLWGQLIHPNLMPFYGLYKHKSYFALVSPWASNGTIPEFLVKEPTANRGLLCYDVAKGIDYLHDMDIVHGDLKGVNILVDESCRAYITDFGLSAVEDPEIVAWSRTWTASRGGTVRWQAPELFASESDNGSDSEEPQNTKATDVYAFACVCYEIFTGLIPFDHIRLDFTVVDRVRKGERPILPSGPECHSLGLSDDFRNLIHTCHSEPSERPKISELKSKLDALLPEDTRAPGAWQDKVSWREGRDTADIPLTPQRLDEILQTPLN